MMQPYTGGFLDARGTQAPDTNGLMKMTIGNEFQRKEGEAQRANQLQLGQIAADASKYPAQLAQDRFNQLFPFLTSQFGNLGNAAAERIGGDSGQGPHISTGPVWNDQQVNQQVNASHALGDKTTATNIKNMRSDLGGRGFGANSPLAQALSGQMQSANLANNTANDRQTRWGAAQGNATQLLNSQQAREGQFATRQTEDISRRAPYYAQQNALLAALASLG